MCGSDVLSAIDSEYELESVTQSEAARPVARGRNQRFAANLVVLRRRLVAQCVHELANLMALALGLLG